MNEQVTLFNLVAFATWSLQVTLLVRMHQKHLAREYRIFFAYTAFTLLQSISETAILDYYGFHSRQYFLTYWALFPIQMTLMFFVIQEVYSKVLYRYEGLRTLSGMIFRWAFMLLVVIAIANAVSSPAAEKDWMFSGILKMDYSVRIVEFGLIILLFALAKALALSWRDCIFGIAVGTCFYCSTELAGIAVRTHYFREVAGLVATVQPFFGVISLAVWTAYFYRADHKFREIKLSNPQLEEWNQAVLQFLSR